MLLRAATARAVLPDECREADPASPRLYLTFANLGHPLAQTIVVRNRPRTACAFGHAPCLCCSWMPFSNTGGGGSRRECFVAGNFVFQGILGPLCEIWTEFFFFRNLRTLAVQQPKGRCAWGLGLRFRSCRNLRGGKNPGSVRNFSLNFQATVRNFLARKITGANPPPPAPCTGGGQFREGKISPPRKVAKFSQAVTNKLHREFRCT